MAKPNDLKKAEKTWANQRAEEKARRRKHDTIFTLIEKQKPGFELALPPELTADRFTRIALTAIKQNPKLQQCLPETILGSLMLAAQLGLEINTPLHEGVLIPYRTKDTQGNWTFVCQFQPEYRGHLKLAWNSGLIESIDYDTICQNDIFEYEKGENQKFRHVPSWDKERGEVLGYYAVAKIKGGGFACVVKSVAEIVKHALRFTKSKKSGELIGVWEEHFDSMAIKTCLIELVDKKLPRRTTNEAIRLYKAAQSSTEIKKLDLDLLGKSIAPEDLESEYLDDTKYEVVDEETGEVTNEEKEVIDVAVTTKEKKAKKHEKPKIEETEKPILKPVPEIKEVPFQMVKDAYTLLGNNSINFGNNLEIYYKDLNEAEMKGIEAFEKVVEEIKGFIERSKGGTPDTVDSRIL